MDIHPVCLPVLVLEVATVAHVVTEELGEIFGFTICLGPSIVGRLPCRGRGGCSSFFCLSFFRFDWVAFFVYLWCRFFLDLLFDSLLDHVGCDVEGGLLLIVLETDDTDDLANVALNGEELIHESEL